MASKIVTYAVYGMIAYFILKGVGIPLGSIRGGISSIGSGISGFIGGVQSGYSRTPEPITRQTPSFIYRR
jgi:hypothetical protein